MEYQIQATSSSSDRATVTIREASIHFGTRPVDEHLPNPAELFLSALAACILKSTQRFSGFMQFEYATAEIEVNAVRLEKPPRMETIKYRLRIVTNNDINLALLKKNIEKFGTIYNTINAVCTIVGEIELCPLDE